MKSQMLRVVLVMAVSIIGALSLSAQSEQSLVATIPFTFSIQQEQFAAGQYVVEPLQHGYVRLRSSDDRSVVLHVIPNYSRANRGPKGKLVFARYGSEYFLHQAWIPSCDFGMEFSSSNRETSVAKQMKKQKELVAVQGH
jgi:hypothetical protein